MTVDVDLELERFGGAGDGQQLGLGVIRCQALGGHPVDDFVYIMLQRLSVCSRIDRFE